MCAAFINSSGGSSSSLQHTEERKSMMLTQGGRQCWLRGCREDVTPHVSPQWGQELCQGSSQWWLPLSQQRKGFAAWMLCLAKERPWMRRKGLAAMVTTKPLLDLHYPVQVGWKDGRWSFLVDLEDTCTPHFVNVCLHCPECGSAPDRVFWLSDSIPCMLPFIQGSQNCLQSFAKLVNWYLPEACR